MMVVAGFLLGVVLSALINVLTALFSREHGVRMIPWMTFYITVHGVYVALTTELARGFIMAEAVRFHGWKSYVVVMIAAAVLAALFWRTVLTSVETLDRATKRSAVTEPRAVVVPQIVAGAVVSQAFRDKNGLIHLGRDVDQDNSFVVLATFRNEPTTARQSRPVKALTASISYHNLRPVGTGFWLGSESPTVDLNVHAEQSIALVYVVPWTPMAVSTGRPANGHAELITDERAAARGEITYITFATRLGAGQPESHVTETLHVTIVESGSVLGEANYELRLGGGRPQVTLVEWLPSHLLSPGAAELRGRLDLLNSEHLALDVAGREKYLKERKAAEEEGVVRDAIEEMASQINEAVNGRGLLTRPSRAARRARLAYEEAHQPRRLREDQVSAIVKTVGKNVSSLRKQAAAHGGLTQEEVNAPIPIMLISVGSERETLNYRSDLAKAFEGGGLAILLEECTAGAPEHEQFTNAVTVLQETSKNVVRPFVIDALRAAGIAPREVDTFPTFSHRMRHEYARPASRIVIGQRDV